MFEDAIRNRLLATLAHDDLVRWLPELRVVPLVHGQVLHDAGERAEQVYFPTTAVVALFCAARPAAAAAVAMVGMEGVVGAPSLADDDAGPPQRAVVLRAGEALRLPAHVLRGDLARGGVVQLLLRHAQALFTQAAQTAACLHRHAVLQQMSRWLLLSLDRSAGEGLATTQATIAAHLGVRRAGVGAALRALQDCGLVRCARGRVTVLDRAAIELQACDCYRLIRDEYRRLRLGPEAPAAAPSSR